MPKRSIASLGIVKPIEPIPFAPAPADLSNAEATLWRDTVHSKPADWFGPDTSPVLKEYVRAAVMCDTLSGIVADAFKDGDLKAVRTALGMRDKESKRVTVLATKLRLTQQSRYTPQAAATADKRANGKRPWQKGRL